MVRSIKLDMIFGRLRPRERLVEDDLVARFTRRVILRAAFVELEQLGIVVRRPNRGAMVRDYTAREIDEVYEMRAHLQAEAARRMPMPANRELTAQLSRFTIPTAKPSTAATCRPFARLTVRLPPDLATCATPI